MPNPLGMRGISFIEFSSPEPAPLRTLFKELGFSRVGSHRSGQKIEHFKQNGINFTLNHEPDTFAAAFNKAHGPSVSSMGWLVEDASKALEEAIKRGAKPFNPAEAPSSTYDAPAIYGIGDSLIYFLEGDKFFDQEFTALKTPELVPAKGFFTIDHLTNNVYKGDLIKWADFYKNVFGFEEIRYFDIRGEKTGLLSYALRSPCGTFSIPINEGTETKSQIEEYLREYKGPGVQHIALATPDLLTSLDHMEGTNLKFLDIEPAYYTEAFARVPNVTEDKDHIRRHMVLVDGDEEGYLLQIFTQNAIGPIFFELIQRKNHFAFGEGNFGALFRSIERDQERRGVL